MGLDGVAIGAPSQYHFTRITSPHNVDADFEVNYYSVCISRTFWNDSANRPITATMTRARSLQLHLTDGASFRHVEVDSLGVDSTTNYIYPSQR